MIPQTTSVQRLVGTFARHGIRSSLLVQLQHVQELAIAVNLQGDHHIALSLSGFPGHQDLTVMGKAAGDDWADRRGTMTGYVIAIPKGGNEAAMRLAHSQLANAAADLMALLEEDAP